MVTRGLGWARDHATLVDGVITAILVAVALPGLWLVRRSGAPSGRPPDLGAVVLTLVIVVPVAWRRRWPGAVLAVSGTAVLIYDLVAYPWGLAWLATLFAVYSTAAHRRRPSDRWVIGLWIAEVLVDGRYGADRGSSAYTLAVLAITAFVWIRGDAVRARRFESEALRDRAEMSERERESRAREAVADERARIARELHDVVAHALGVIVMQAGGAGRVPRLGEAQAKSVLSTIEETGRRAFAEMRQLVGVLRDDDEAAALAPQPTVSEVPALLAQLQGAGLDVSLQSEGDAVPLSTGVELAAYRIIQEALTNALKHAGPTRARVRLAWSPTQLEIEVIDDGPAGSAHSAAPVRPDHGGHGLIGMRERALLLGGDLRAEPRHDGGYHVIAHFPVAVGEG